MTPDTADCDRCTCAAVRRKLPVSASTKNTSRSRGVQFSCARLGAGVASLIVIADQFMGKNGWTKQWGLSRLQSIAI
jgi:hypothetical protein